MTAMTDHTKSPAPTARRGFFPPFAQGWYLRSKLTFFNLLLIFAVILILGVYIYIRIQIGGDQLFTRLEENNRIQAEESLKTSSHEQAALLDGFFENMARNTSIVGSSLRDLFEQQEALGGSGYWDARASLVQLDTGSWDNGNSEPASIFIPAGVPLTDSFISKLNLLKHAELVFPSILKDNPDILAIYFGGASRETIYYPNIDLAHIVPADFDVTGRAWYVAAEPDHNPEGRVVWSAPYEDAALHGLVITASVPVRDAAGRFKGVAAMDVQLRRITDQAAGITVGETGYAFLVDSENRIISLPAAGYDDFAITDEAARLSGIIDTTVLTATSPELLALLDGISQADEGLFTIEMNGLGRYAAYHIVEQTDYKLVILVPAAELLTGTSEISSQIAAETRSTLALSLFIILVIFLAAGGVAFAVNNNLTRPLQSLNRVASEIIRGNYDEKAEVTSGDEIETLGRTLNTMTSAVKELVSSLEQRVAERTVELEREIQRGERRRKQYEAIARVAQEITARKNLRDLLPQITEVIGAQFGFYHVGIFLNDNTNKYAVLAAANSEGGQRMLERGHQLAIGTQGIVGRVTGTKQPRISLNVKDDSAYFTHQDLVDTKSEMALPLIEGDKVLGALDAQSKEANAFSEEDTEALTVLAELVSIAIQNARLNEQTERSLAEAEAASRQYIRENWNRLAEEYKILGYRYTAGGANPITSLDDPAQESEKGSGRKTVKAPIVMRGEEVGELSVLMPQNEIIHADQMELIRAVADRVAVIAENARLFDETARRAERERLVSDITTKIRASADQQTMIETAVRELREALKVSRVEIVPRKKISPDR
jgi:GAF domain-containing protein/HAMP domain-containing protein